MLSGRYAVVLILLLCIDASLSSPSKQTEFKSQEIDKRNSQDVKVHQKRFVLSSFLAAMSAAQPVLGIVKELGYFIYGIVQEQQNITQVKKINDQLLVIEEKLDALSNEMRQNMQILLNGQRWIEGAAIFAQDVQRLKYFLHRLNQLQPDEDTGRLQPADEAEEWAESVLDMTGRSLGQILFSFNDMMVGTTQLFGQTPLYRVYLATLEQDNDYWHKAREFIEYTYTLQVLGYAAYATAYNIKGLPNRVPRLQRLVNKRLTKQETILASLSMGWPAGMYGTPMTNNGCPGPDGDTWQPWVTGWRKHDAEDLVGTNEWSPDNHFPDSFYSSNMQQKFCMRRSDHAVAEEWRGNGSWPSGSYCLFRQGTCHSLSGFSPGFIQWDDEDSFNSNSKGGELPHGVYDRNTRILYCCRSDGEASSPISLPTREAFYLFRHHNQCQEVKYMHVREEWFSWVIQQGSHMLKKGSVEESPDETGDSGHVVLHYCYYSPTV